MTNTSYQRPPTLYRYSQRQWLEPALTQGQFRLRPAGGCLTLGFSKAWEPQLFDAFGGADCCLVIHNTEEFGERLHRAVQRLLPNWAGIDGAVTYGARSPLGAAFSKAREEAGGQEWQFAWRPMQAGTTLNPVLVNIGSIERFAELREKDSRPT
jgi:hypothetical protein